MVLGEVGEYYYLKSWIKITNIHKSFSIVLIYLSLIIRYPARIAFLPVHPKISVFNCTPPCFLLPNVLDLPRMAGTVQPAGT